MVHNHGRMLYGPIMAHATVYTLKGMNVKKKKKNLFLQINCLQTSKIIKMSAYISTITLNNAKIFAEAKHQKIK